MKTYAGFKVFMRDEHAALDMVRALSIKDTSLDQANMLQALSSQQEQLDDNFQKILFQAFETYAHIEQHSPSHQSSQNVAEANNDLPSEISNMISNISSKSSSSDQNILSMLQKMMEKMSELETKVHGTSPNKSKVIPKLNPKMAKHGNDTAGHVAAVIIGENFAHSQRRDIKTKRPSNDL